MKEQFVWPLTGSAVIEADARDWTIRASGLTFGRKTVDQVIADLSGASVRYVQLKQQLPVTVEHSEYHGAIGIHVNGSRSGITIMNLLINILDVPDLVASFEDARERGDHLVALARGVQHASLPNVANSGSALLALPSQPAAGSVVVGHVINSNTARNGRAEAIAADRRTRPALPAPPAPPAPESVRPRIQLGKPKK